MHSRQKAVRSSDVFPVLLLVIGPLSDHRAAFGRAVHEPLTDEPKSDASKATIAVDDHVIERIARLKTIEVVVCAGRARRRYKAVKSDGPEDVVFQSVKTGAPIRDNFVLCRHIKPAARKLGLEFVKLAGAASRAIRVADGIANPAETAEGHIPTGGFLNRGLRSEFLEGSGALSQGDQRTIKQESESHSKELARRLGREPTPIRLTARFGMLGALSLSSGLLTD